MAIGTIGPPVKGIVAGVGEKGEELLARHAESKKHLRKLRRKHTRKKQQAKPCHQDYQ